MWNIIWMALGLFAFFSAFAFAVGMEGGYLQRVRVVAHALAGVALFWVGVSPAVERAAFDDTPYLQITEVLPLETTARPGDQVPVSYTVFKRPGCSGEVFTFAARADGSEKIRLRNFDAQWPDGLGTHTYAYNLPDDIALGRWGLYFRVETNCKAVGGFGATTPSMRLHYQSRPVMVSVLPE